MSSPRKAVVFDLDGVLVDCSERLREAERRAGCRKCPGFQRIFHDPALIEELDKPRVTGVRLARRRMEEGYMLVIITGRPAKLAGVTRRQLREIGVSPSLLLMRPPNTRSPTPRVKANLVEKLVYEDGLMVVEIHDDDPSSLHAMGAVAREASLYLHLPGGKYEAVRTTPRAPRSPHVREI